MFVRRASVLGKAVLQGVLIDRAALERDLPQVVADVFPEAQVIPVPTHRIADDETGRVLAAAPYALAVAPVPVPKQPLATATNAALATAWLAVLAALVAAAASVHGSLAHARRRDRLATAVTHELRTPLTSFRMVADLLADDMVPDEARRRAHARTLRTEAERLSAVVENVLGYARVERGSAPISPQRTDLRALHARIDPVLRRRAERDGAELSWPEPSETPVTTDPGVVQRILVNLVDNACKYGASDGDTARIEVSSEVQGDVFRTTVRDDGPGVPGRLRQDVFAAFDRGLHAADGARAGAGLGLTLSRELARRLGGDLRLVPSDRGATFELALPAQQHRRPA